MQLTLRCLQIDLARQKESVEFVKSYIDFAKAHGYNAILAYLENAVRTQDTAYFSHEDTYSIDEMKEIVAHAESKGIQIIPAFENLGHLEKFFAYPQLENLSECENAELEGRGFSRGRGNCGCTQKKELYKFLDKYITEVSSLFNSNYVHMGLDEPFDFAVCPRCKAEMEKGKTKTDLFYEHLIHTYNLIHGMGKTMMMWDDFFEYADVVDKLPRDIIFCNWNYYFVGDEPAGHWTNRIKRDWFAYYEKLGFRYMFCTNAHDTSSVHNIDSFTAYASKYKPFGALMTSWEKADGFYFGTYPVCAYAGEKWLGNIKTEKDKLALYTELLGDEECAKIVLSLQIPSFYGGYKNGAVLCDNDSLVKYSLRATLSYAVEKLQTYTEKAVGLQKDIVTDIYDKAVEMLCGLQLELLAKETFDNYETQACPSEYFLEKFDEIERKYAVVEANETALWEKYRHGILSSQNKLQRKHGGVKSLLDGLKANAKKQEKRGVLYMDMMMHEAFGTPRAEIYITYEGEDEKLLYKGGIKPTTTAWELTGCYTLRIATENKKVQSVRYSHYGESALYPMHFRHTANGEKQVVSAVEVLQGEAEYTDNLLYNDARFALLGNGDGLAHFNDLSLGKKRHEILIKFKPLV